MLFEFGPAKCIANRVKHGIDFTDAQALWNDVLLLEVPARTEDEPRFLVIGRIGAKHWAAVVAHRGESMRIISVRRARKEEIAAYESP